MDKLKRLIMDDNDDYVDYDLPFDYGLRLLADAIDHPSLQSPKQTNRVDHFASAATYDKAFFDKIPRKERTPRKRKRSSSSWSCMEIIYPKRTLVMVTSDDQQPRGYRTAIRGKIRKSGCEADLESAVSMLLEGNNTSSSGARKPRENNVVKRQQPSKIGLQFCPKSPPGNLSALIEDRGGTDVKLVIRKEIQQTDLQRNHNRMSIPPSKLVARDFLSEGEEKIIEKGNIKVRLIDPCLDLINNLSLRKWEMSKSFIYVLYNWNWVVQKNNFVKGEVVQLWSFRVAGELWLALVRENGHAPEIEYEERGK